MRATPLEPGLLHDRRLLVLLMLLVLGVVSPSCDGCQCGGTTTAPGPMTPSQRIEAYAGHMPADVDAALFFVEMDQVRAGLAMLAERFQGNLPVDAYRQEITRVVGVDLLDAASWTARGLSPADGFAVASYHNAPVVLAFVVDRDAFEKGVIGSLETFYRGTPEGRVIDTSQLPAVTTVHGRDGAELSWAWLDGGMVIVTGPSLLATAAPAAGPDAGAAPAPEAPGTSSAQILRQVLAASATRSLNAPDVPEFAAFRRQVADASPASAFLRTPTLLNLYGTQDDTLKNYQREVLGAFADHIVWTGAGFSADDKAARAQLHFGIDAPTLERVKGLDQAPKPSPKFRLMVNERAYLVARASVDAALFWREYQALLPPSQKRFLDKLLSNIKSTTQIDIEKDVIENASGNAAVAVYGLDLARLSERRFSDRARAVTVVAHVQLKDPARFVSVVDRIVGELNGAIGREQLTSEIALYRFNPNSTTAPPFALYMMGDVVTLSTTTITPELMRSMLTGDGKTLVKAVDGEQARALLNDERASGLYVNVDKARRKAGSLGSGLVEQLLGPIEALTVRLGMTDTGLVADLEIALHRGPQPPDAPAEDDLGAAPVNPPNGAPEGDAPAPDAPDADDAPDASDAPDAGPN